MVRDIDHTGVSGIGIVAEGVVFSDNSAVMRWMVVGAPSTTTYYKSISDVEHIHNHKNTKHEGGTRLEWID